jgi:hypothetical protein
MPDFGRSLDVIKGIQGLLNWERAVWHSRFSTGVWVVENDEIIPADRSRHPWAFTITRELADPAPASTVVGPLGRIEKGYAEG